MYAVAKEHRSNKLLTQVRRAPTLDKFDGPISVNRPNSIELNEICKPALQLKQCALTPQNNKLYRATHQDQQNEEISVQHEDMIRYINDSWRRIQRELEYLHNKPTNVGDNNQVNGSKMVDTANTTFVKIKHINSSTSSSIPKNFVPFDLESFFGQRFIQKLLQSSS
ncbi:uncharacterized protein LOC124495542 [Dermatophagoides farinae]|uniref:Mapk regulated corepressor interacting protein 2-like isoform x1 n=1 Tax=Dermatophagoides farinae TaxID=6954 RepID=A0A922I8C7_DERFA|nr:uncharacterized protein LOC124495542 [Dermatophagoides farinae]KAH7640682.1 mapk regulated corepressor interacting protein 2-like isoform x1 [Dermatophagoides farinae]KAH9526220.1 hypothetical protein DERF_000320 [Dermatophagoides farinae]